jgi:hypothetical protein
MKGARSGQRLIRICYGAAVYEIDENGRHKTAMPRAPRRNIKALACTMDPPAVPSPPPEWVDGAAPQPMPDGPRELPPILRPFELSVDLPGQGDMFFSNDFDSMFSEPAGDDNLTDFAGGDDGEPATQIGDMCWPLK